MSCFGMNENCHQTPVSTQVACSLVKRTVKSNFCPSSLPPRVRSVPPSGAEPRPQPCHRQ